ncbi:LolA family protein [Kordiimonas lacus]|uniref:Outer membrane lipoprotein-sorting protein n=1 Tax=Kordiimonas lacus TaxID=637679 RepID=A0A1G6TJN1_9PROT|nr:outer-membrane lipoprotein carrier protein LolA [Kordiimonas lacus]SDD29074.1 Outer membrane lipoprotein-sorting protein [Kordiimonas lacus]
MRSLPLFGVYLALLAPAAVAQDTALPPLEEQTVIEDQSLKALRQVQDYMDGVETLEAEFRQHAPNGNIATGRLYLERPGYVRFDYTDETPFLIVADGKTLNFVDYEIGQVTKWPLKKTPLRALLGGSVDLASLQAHIEMGRPGFEDLILLSARDPENPEQGEITLNFMPDDSMPTGLRLLGWQVLDAKGEITQLTLTDQKVNTALDDALWTFEDPRGLTKRRRTRR